MEPHGHDPALDAHASPPSPDPAAAAPPNEGKTSFVVRLFAIGLPVVICLSGVAVAGVLMATRPEAERAEQQTQGLPVRVAEVTVGSADVQVRAQGEVLPARQVVLQPELSGRVVWMNQDLVPGGHFEEGEDLLRIDPRDYRAALEAERAQLENSRLQMQQEGSRRTIAQREWELMAQERLGTTPEGRDLALHEPQVRSAQASVRAARSGLQRAQTNLSRTTLVAPFDAFVQSENVDRGQLVGPSAQLATLVGTEHFWVQVSVPMEQLRWIRAAGPDGEGGSQARVTQEVGGEGEIVRHGRVIRILGDLDPVGRMARVLVEIDDPLGLTVPEGEEPGLPMLLGAFVHVRIDAGRLDDVVEVPREALHADDTVYLLDDESRLAVRQVSVVWRREQTVLVRGLEPSQQLIVSQVPTPVEGTLLRRIEDTQEATSDEADEPDAAEEAPAPTGEAAAAPAAASEG